MPIAKLFSNWHTVSMGIVSELYRSTETVKDQDCVTFNREELNSILRVYGQMVQAGKWRDYAISSLKTKAIFCVFKRSAEHPIYMIIKNKNQKKRNGLYSIVAMDGLILKRDNNLKRVLRAFNTKLFSIV